MRTSPSGSTGESPRMMIPPHHPFANALPAARTTSLTAPNAPLTGTRSPGYSSHSYSHSTSPSTGSGSLPESQNHEPPLMMISPTQISSASLNAQKRAYRQRRKDPSCDACRERKVKCDATETSACSECSSRNHKCQFTKETNRRMSSIKQVQDLQSQIAELTQMNTHLRTKATGGDNGEFERSESKRRHSEAHTGAPTGPHRVSAPAMRNFDHVRDNIRAYSRGILVTHPPVLKNASSALPALPPRGDFGRLSRPYCESIHKWYPAFHWPSFLGEVDKTYAVNSSGFEGRAREWLGLFFAVLACGTLQGSAAPYSPTQSSSDGSVYFQYATQALMPWTQDLSIEYAQAALLLSIYATERNWRSVGSMWLGAAVRAAQELNLHCVFNVGGAVEREVRRRLWWAIYVRDRITSLDSCRPMLISEDDCDTPLPAPVEDNDFGSVGFTCSYKTTPPYSGPVAVIQMTRLYAPVYQALKSSVIQPQTLKSLDENFLARASLLPESYRVGSQAPLEMTALPPLFALLSAQFHLYRRNLTPVCRPAERSEALNRCLSIAQETAKYISRTLHSPPRLESENSWQTRVTQVASNMTCLHVWRCMLVLCFRGDYDAAFVCLHLASAIGKTRKVNSECGKYLVFFVDQLLDRVRNGRGSAQELEHDEEMIAYVSGDVQANVEHSWVWAGTNSTMPTPPYNSSFSTTRSHADELMRDAPNSPLTNGIEWDNWSRLEHGIRQLMEETRPRTASYYSTPHNPVKRVQLAQGSINAPNQGPSPSPAPSSSSRISIANII